MHDATLDEYDRHAGRLLAAGEAVRDQLASWLGSDAAIDLHSVTVRVKDRASLAEKLARPDRTYAQLWDVTDLVGIRVITYFGDSIDRVAKLLESKLPIDFQHSIDKRRHDDEATFGYRSLHYVCRLAPGSATELPAAARIEIQVRTMLEHAWAAIEHSVGYKARESVPVAARRRLSRLAGLLELADQEFVAIRRELGEYTHALAERIASSDDDLALDRLSLVSLLAQREVHEVDLAIADQLGRPLGEDPFFPEYLVRMLHASGLDTVAATRDALARHRTAILGMVAPYFRFATAAWGLAPAQMHHLVRGYSLFFLAHALVLEAPTLGLTKVERLTRLYQELDYPDDPRLAHRVASGLVEALSTHSR